MNTEQIIDLISDHLQEVNDNTEERLKRIDEMLFSLNYNRRLTELSDEEKQDFVYCNEGYPWTEKMKTAYDNASDDKAKAGFINMCARSTYFRLCMWQDYLCGNRKDKPYVEKVETKAT